MATPAQKNKEETIASSSQQLRENEESIAGATEKSKTAKPKHTLKGKVEVFISGLRRSGYQMLLTIGGFVVLVAAVLYTQHSPTTEVNNSLLSTTAPPRHGANLRQSLGYVFAYLAKTKYALERSSFDLPNTLLLKEAYAGLVAELQCNDIVKLSQSAKEVFKCSTEKGNYFIKIPPNSSLANRPFIREIVGSVFYSGMLNIEINQRLYAEEGRALVSQELQGFMPLSTYFKHVLVFDKQFNAFKEALLFNNSFCVDADVISSLHSGLFDIAFGQQEGIINKACYFIFNGLANLVDLGFKLIFQYNLDVSLLRREHTPKYNAYCSQYNMTNITGLYPFFLTSYLLHNEDLNFRNLGFINMSTHLQVVGIDYDQVGSGFFTGDIKTDISSHLELSRLLFWSPQSVEMINANDYLSNQVKKMDRNETSKMIKDKLPGVAEEEIVTELQEIFKYRCKISDVKSKTVSQNIIDILDEVLPRRLKKVKTFYQGNPHFDGGQLPMGCV